MEESISSTGSQDLNFFHLQNRVINSFYDYNWNTTILKFKVYLKKINKLIHNKMKYNVYRKIY